MKAAPVSSEASSFITACVPPDAGRPSLEKDLIRLLCVLEHARAGMIEAREANRPNRFLEATEVIFRQVLDFAEHHLSQAERAKTPWDVLAKVENFLDELRTLQRTFGSPGLSAILSKCFKRSSEPSEAQRQQLHRLTDTLCDIVLGYFVLFTDQFPTSVEARNWVESAAAFLVALRQLVAKVRAGASPG